MGKVSNRFFITTIQDGHTITVSLVSNMKLTQTVVNGSCTPNWNAGETGAVTPLIYVYSRLDGVARPPVAGSGTWYWNGTPLTFNAQNKSTVTDAAGYPLFEQTAYNSLPALRIIRNIGSTGNPDNDVISYSGTMELGGVPQAFSVDTVVRISVGAGAGYNAIMGGDREVTSATAGQTGYTAKVFAQLYSNSSPITTGLTARFYREGIDGATVVDGWPKTVGAATATDETTPFGNLIPAGSYAVTVNASEITDRVVIRCDFIKDNEVIASCWTDVDDRTDPEEMFIVNSTTTTVGQSDIQLRAGQTVAVKAWMGYSTNMYSRYPGYNTFKCQLTDANGKVLRSGNPVPAGATVDAAGYFNITKADMTVADKNGNTLLASGYGGQISIAADDIDTYCGGGLGGTITAEEVTTV